MEEIPHIPSALKQPQLLREYGIYEKFKNHIYPATYISMGEKGRCPLGASKRRGVPDLPVETPWPMTGDNRELYKEDLHSLDKEFFLPNPLDFICQINLADIPHREKLPPFPKDGLLSFFWSSYKNQDFIGYYGYVTEKDWRVIYTPADKELKPAAIPDLGEWVTKRSKEDWREYMEEFEASLKFQPTEIFNYRGIRPKGVSNEVPLKIRNVMDSLFLGVRDITYSNEWARSPAFIDYCERNNINLMPAEYQNMSREALQKHLSESDESSDEFNRKYLQNEVEFFKDWIPLVQFDTSLGGCTHTMVFWIKAKALEKGDFSDTILQMSW